MKNTALIDAPQSTVPLFDLSAMSAEVDVAIEAGWKRILETHSFVGGPYVERFEKEWAEYCGTRYAVGVANGTDALELTLRAAGIGPGDEVILPANTFTATAEGVVMAGATPRFADVDPHTLLLTHDTVAPALTDRTAAIIAVHLYGHMADIGAIRDLASERGLLVIEDAAQAQGATWNGRRAGSWGHAGCFSFYPGKNLGAYGDAGAVVTDDPALAATIRSLSNHGRSTTSKYAHDSAGRNSRLDALQAVVLSTKLPHLDGWNAARRQGIARYAECLQDRADLLLPVAVESCSVYHQNVVRVPGRARVQSELQGHNVQTAIHYPTPLHEMGFYGYSGEPLPVAEFAANEVLSLPLFPGITPRQIESVCSHLGDVLDDV
jgi:dTDP-4-amino-4,6-dideoxygalactose transaminase